MVGGEAAQLLVGVDLASPAVEPVEAEVADAVGRHARSLPEVTVRRSDEVDAADDRPHPDAGVEEWVFTAWLPGGVAGLVSAYRRPSATAGWYWSALARRDEPLLHVGEWDVPVEPTRCS